MYFLCMHKQAKLHKSRDRHKITAKCKQCKFSLLLFQIHFLSSKSTSVYVRIIFYVRIYIYCNSITDWFSQWHIETTRCDHNHTFTRYTRHVEITTPTIMIAQCIASAPTGIKFLHVSERNFRNKLQISTWCRSVQPQITYVCTTPAPRPC